MQITITMLAIKILMFQSAVDEFNAINGVNEGVVVDVNEGVIVDVWDVVSVFEFSNEETLVVEIGVITSAFTEIFV